MTIDVRGRRTERLLGMVALIAVAVAAALLPSFTPIQAAMFYTCATAVVLGGLWRQGWLGGARRLTGLAWLADGRWLLTDARQSGMPAELLGGSRVGSRWLWLRWSADYSQRRSMLLLQGDLPAADLRRLVVRLRLQSTAPRAQSPGA